MSVGEVVGNDTASARCLMTHPHCPVPLIPAQWQLVQGGIEAGEELKDAALREIHEEVGLTASDLTYVGVLGDPIQRWKTSQPPPGQPKQTIYFTLVYWPEPDLRRCKLDNEPEPEFTELRFMTWEQLMTDHLAELKRGVYNTVRPLAEQAMQQFLQRQQA